jgi:hypothetical protein
MSHSLTEPKFLDRPPCHLLGCSDVQSSKQRRGHQVRPPGSTSGDARGGGKNGQIDGGVVSRPSLIECTLL